MFMLDRWDTPPKPETAGHTNNEREDLRVVRMQLARGGVARIAPTDLLAVKSWNQRPEVWSRPLKTERLDLIIARDPAGIQAPDYSNSWFKSLCVIYDSLKVCWLNRKWSIIGEFSAFRGSQTQNV